MKKDLQLLAHIGHLTFYPDINSSMETEKVPMLGAQTYQWGRRMGQMQ